jgi:hypothetical protein
MNLLSGGASIVFFISLCIFYHPRTQEYWIYYGYYVNFNKVTSELLTVVFGGVRREHLE